MKTFRKIFFWAHLASGIIAGISIAVMCFTGAALAFEGEIVAWTERDVRQVTPPALEAPRLSLDALLAKVRAAKPGAVPTGITVSNDPKLAVTFAFGRDGAAYANPYTGEVKLSPVENKTHDFLHVMEDWHRVLAMSGDNRATGKLINGVCNIAFCFLALSGLYLWWPRSWSWRSVKAIALFNWKFKGKARDFNWHNVIGLWSAPILIVLTLTAIPISFRWGGNLIYTLVGETPPTQQPGPGGGAAPAVVVPKPDPGTRPLGYDALLMRAQSESPRWETISFRLGTPGGRGGQRPGARAAAGAAQAANAANGVPGAPANPAAPIDAPRAEDSGRRPEGNARAEGGARRNAAGAGEAGRGAGPEGRAAPSATAVSVSVKEKGTWPRTASTTLSLNPYTGDVLKTEGFADMTTARQVRSWTRFLHTGQALGWGGQLLAGLACVGGCVLVYTGFALSWRRFFFKKKKSEPAPAHS